MMFENYMNEQSPAPAAPLGGTDWESQVKAGLTDVVLMTISFYLALWLYEKLGK